ncbi:MAG: hypothetical protein JSR85_04875 [Proteobacteria bacterium]|nr:hypothetical protein [Pseudomonadota bacterium]
MRHLLILLSAPLCVALSSPLLAKQKVSFDATPLVGYRQDNINWKTKTGSTEKWKNLQGIDYGIKTTTTFKDRYKMYIDLGFANFFSGKMTDSNYLAAPGSGNPTNNSLNGKGFAFRPNIAFGFNMKPLKSLDLIPQLGFVYDRIKLNGKKTSDNPLTSLTNTLQWYGPYVGLDSKTKFGQRWTMTASGSINLSFYNGSGNWKFTGDQTNNTMKQNGHGYGLMGKLGVQYLVVKTVTLGCEGDIHWNRVANNGNDRRNFANGTSIKSKLKNVNWTSFAGRLTLTKTF